MITLLTGLPGNGKTLFALYLIKAKAEKETREVYYHNINQLTLPWMVFEPTKWLDLPQGSIIVIDEAQDIFPKKPNGSSLPNFYSELAKHRHHGFDIYLITQHPTLIDSFVRKLVGQHYHSIRKFGMERATIYEWSAVNAAPEMAASHKNAITLKWAFPKEVYTYYKSAEVHTVKRAFPMKLIIAILFVLSVPLIGYYVLSRFQERGKVNAASLGVVSSVRPGSPAGLNPVFDPMTDAKQFVAMNTPRVPGLPQTAPKFDELTKPTSVPVPAVCIFTVNACRCFTQQASAMEVGLDLCREFAKNGFFQEFDSDKNKNTTVPSPGKM